MDHKNILTRRAFTGAAITALSYRRILGANNRVRLGYIGLGNRGDQVHEAFLEYGDQETAAVCDLRDDYMDFAIRKSQRSPTKYTDYRKLLDDKSLDAVVIATPDHWHALMFVQACHAGKDVYCEKPLSLTVAEGRKMVDTAAATKRVVQVGIQRRSATFLQEAVEFVRSGGIGEVTVARGFHIQNEWPNGIGMRADGPAPSEQEWEQWLGPAPYVPYNRNRSFYDFRWFYNYSGGQLTNFGVHYVDMLRWLIGKDSPKTVTALGGHYVIKDNREIPDTLMVTWDYGNVLVMFEQINGNGAPPNTQNSEMELRGTLGTMYIHSNRWEVVPEKVTDKEFFARTPLDRASEKAWNPSKTPRIEGKIVKGVVSNMPHARNFLDCLKTRAKTNCDTLTGFLSTSATQIANIALQTKSTLEWDAKAEKFTNNPAANRLLEYKYRAPYKLG